MDIEEDWYGLHERLDTPALRRTLERLGLAELARWTPAGLTSERLPHLIAAHLARAISARLLDLRTAGGEEWARALASLEALMRAAGHPLEGLASEVPSAEPRALIEVVRPVQAALQAPPTERPDVPLALSALLTGSRHSPSLVTQIEKELASADRADWLVSFIRFSGLRPLRDALRDFTRTPSATVGPRLRIATTSYMGATESKALEFLLELPNTELRVSYDTHRTRLHAKAYLFHRRTGFGTAYVGSANLSRVALDEGLEWTARISQQELPHVWRQLSAGFEMHWADEGEFEPLQHDSLPRFRAAVAAQRERDPSAPALGAFFDLRPHAFQQRILDDLAAERAMGRRRHLVIAATGTGKTMVAAFDYQRYCEEHGGRPRLLFLAHRKELLEQARRSFREVLRDAGFGELVVDGQRAERGDHVFCGIQSWRGSPMSGLPPEHFDYVVVDEAHHAPAQSYQAVLARLRPGSLLGLTATPERSDGGDIREDFGGTYSHELRLPEAVEARLLAPFHYFGIEDAEGVDFSGLDWSAGRYDAGQLGLLIDHNEVRARWVLKQVHLQIAEPNAMRGLGFCVSQAHAHFMAAFFNRHGLPSEALTADTPAEQRARVRQRLVAREINLIFSVDLFNEGVDIPEVDTVLMLRPTESLTVYLQQLGRGLRLHPDKAHLTVLDFVAPQRREFRYAERFRALGLGGSAERPRIDHEVEQGFGSLPSGCLIHLTRIARTRVLANIRGQIGLNRTHLEGVLREMMERLGRRPTLQQMLDHLIWDSPDAILSKGLPSELLGLAVSPERNLIPGANGLQRGLRHLAEADDPELLESLVTLLDQPIGAPPAAPESAALALSLLWGKERTNLQDVLDALRAHTDWAEDVRDVARWRQAGLLRPPPRRLPHLSGALRLHARYTREQIMIALGRWSFEDVGFSNAGVEHCPARRVDAFFVTLDKDPERFSPETRYEDYALNPREFHWQSQARTSADSPTGQRYLRHAELGYTPLLFVRRAHRQPNGLTEPFCYLGPLIYLRHEGTRPISIVWRLQQPMPTELFELAHGSAI